MSEILVVDSNSRFLEIASASVRSLGHEVIEATSKEEAMEYLDGVLFDCVVSSHDLVEGIRSRVTVPVVALAEATEAEALRAPMELPFVSGLFKPCTGYELAMAVQLTIAVQKSPKYFRIPISSVMPSVLSFDVYIVKDGVHQILHAKGTKVEADAWNRFAKDATAEIFASLEGIDRLIPENLRLAQVAAKAPGASISDKAPILVRISELIGERMQHMGVDEITIEHTAIFIETFLQTSLSAPLVGLLEELEKSDRHLFSDSLCSMAVAVMVAQRLNWSQEELQKTAFAGFFHDIGKLQLPAKLLKTPRPLMSFSERAVYDRHPELGKKFLQQSGMVSAEICEIVYQHHEDNNGTGTPRHLKRDAIHPIARLLRVADLFVERAVQGRGRLVQLLDKALESMAKEPGVELEFFLILKELTGKAAMAKAAKKT